jgi:hypothetical protein
MPQTKRCTGVVQIDRRETYGRPYELMTIHLADGAMVCTVADVLAKLGIDVKDGDEIIIGVSVSERTKRRKPR